MNEVDYERREEYNNDADHAIGEEMPFWRPDENLLQRLESLRRQVDRNDSNLRCIEMIGIATSIDGNHSDHFGYIPHDGNWEKVGSSIGRNTHLEEICIDLEEEDFESFSHGLASNQLLAFIIYVP